MVEAPLPYSHVAFAGDTLLARGPLADVAVAVRRATAGGEPRPIVVLETATSQVVDLDLRGSEADVAARYATTDLPPDPASEAASTPRLSPGPGRPRLGVVSREVSLLPRHWEWLRTQRGGASAALRRLVDEARRASATHDEFVAARNAVDRYLHVMSGDRVNYEEALRAFYAGRDHDLQLLTAQWPADICAHLEVLLQRCRGALTA